ncbi:MAG: hypothetical protein ACLFNO_02290 [Parcubacteria group bacterium]
MNFEKNFFENNKKEKNFELNFEEMNNKEVQDSCTAIANEMQGYLSIPANINFKPSKNSENNGFASILHKEYRDPDYQHNITIIYTNEHIEEIPFYLAHELGHCFEEQIIDVAKKNKLEVYPKESPLYDEMDWEGPYGDLIATYILSPESFKKNENLPYLDNCKIIFNEIFENKDFSDLRTQVEKSQKENSQDFIGDRVFDKIKEYFEKNNK